MHSGEGKTRYCVRSVVINRVRNHTLDVLTSRRSSPAVKSARNLTADGMARILLAPMNH